MNRRCVRCKKIQKESSFKYHERTKKDLMAPFYCKKCIKKKNEPLEDEATIKLKKQARREKFLTNQHVIKLKLEMEENEKNYEKIKERMRIRSNYLIPSHTLVNMVKNPH